MPKDDTNYGAIARLAVQQNGSALRFVLTDRADYGQIAKLAVQQAGGVLNYVPTDHADFGEIARIAVQQNGLALEHVLPTRTAPTSAISPSSPCRISPGR